MEIINIKKIKSKSINNLRNDLPIISPGDIVEIKTKSTLTENIKRSKTDIFKGLIILCRRVKSETFMFRVISDNYRKGVVEKTFFYHSPSIISINKIGRIKKVRRAALYYLKRIMENKKIEK